MGLRGAHLCVRAHKLAIEHSWPACELICYILSKATSNEETHLELCNSAWLCFLNDITLRLSFVFPATANRKD